MACTPVSRDSPAQPDCAPPNLSIQRQNRSFLVASQNRRGNCWLLARREPDDVSVGRRVSQPLQHESQTSEGAAGLRGLTSFVDRLQPRATGRAPRAPPSAPEPAQRAVLRLPSVSRASTRMAAVTPDPQLAIIGFAQSTSAFSKAETSASGSF